MTESINPATKKPSRLHKEIITEILQLLEDAEIINPDNKQHAIAFEVVSPINTQSQSEEETVNLKISPDISVTLSTQDHLDLIDGKISEVTINQYTIRRRLGTRPVAYDTDGTKLFNLYFDVFNQQGDHLGSKLHNQNKPQYVPPKGNIRTIRRRPLITPQIPPQK